MNRRDNRRQYSARLKALKLLVFGGVIAVFFFIGCLNFLRPEASELEKRTLTEHPKFSWNSFWDGSYFSQLSIWYADTYPLREPLIAANRGVEQLYGFRSEQIVGETTQVADDIPEITTEAEPKEDAKDDKKKSDAETKADDKADDIEAKAEDGSDAETKVDEKADDKTDENLPDGTIKDIGEKVGSIYVTDGAGYEMFYFNQPGADAFAETMNNIYSRVGDMVDIYVMAIPTSAGAMLDQKVIDDMGASDQKKVLEYLYSKINPSIKTVMAIDELRKHNSEYIYFRTDHHWTQRGAYYGYRAFCQAKGITPNDIDSFETITVDGFKGTFIQQAPKLADHPDQVIGYIPKGTNSMKMVASDGITYDWFVVNDVTGYAETELYGMYSGGDNSFSMVHNEQISDGSAVMVIKDSYGNAFVPWLVDHYEYVYWVDIRYTSNTISQMVEDAGIQDVIVAVSLFNGTTEARLGLLDAIGH